MSKVTHLVIDTDIGTDVDDAIALLQVLGAQTEGSLSITTAYGDTKLRAQIAGRYCALVGRAIEIFPGRARTLSGKPIWTSGLEGSLHSQLEDVLISSTNAVEHLLAISSDPLRTVSILAIAPLTNIAEAILEDADFASRISHLYVMAGRFGEGKFEHNIVSDITAAKVVFESGIRISVIGIELTSQLVLRQDFSEKVSLCGDAGSLLSREIEQWSGFWSRDWIVPHDSLAALMLLEPEIFDFSERGRVRIDSDGSAPGRTDFMESADGPHRIVRGFNKERAESAILSAILRHSG